MRDEDNEFTEFTESVIFSACVNFSRCRDLSHMLHPRAGFKKNSSLHILGFYPKILNFISTKFWWPFLVVALFYDFLPFHILQIAPLSCCLTPHFRRQISERHFLRFASSGMKGHWNTKESARRDGASLSTVYCVAIGRLLFETSAAASVFVNICYESYHLLQKHLLLRLFSSGLVKA